MRIKIAGMSIPLTVGFDEQDHVRETERRVAELFDNWRRMFPAKSEQELLAMMTYQYASYYLALSKSREQIAEQLAEFDKQVNDIVVGG
ncbi:MAG: cell division protein ZapA [Muribaculaceae bacterium]|nr:cell division protein ZapA [Muribaculaceae bacterium]